MNRKAFTLLELIIVIIIVGILAVLGLTQYTRTTEKGRSAEAKAILGSLRTAEEAYYLEKGSYASDITVLPVIAPTSCTSTHYFYYHYNPSGGCSPEGQVAALRCTSGGKSPNYSYYVFRLCLPSGRWNNDAGY
ncbi:MAG: prepilin-type N-terminal cleavage/methylation domain-containing protein [Candidatus Omnitrophica bacterium]|nr:prepilin-type N-terminal cleavage/methylation domain-containing protein [Candidatus Omnitrophota bacterium]